MILARADAQPPVAAAPPARLLALNALIRIAAAASGQLFAFVLAERLGARVATGAVLVGVIGACYFGVELLGAPYAGRVADRLASGACFATVRCSASRLRWWPRPRFLPGDDSCSSPASCSWRASPKA